MTTELVAQGRQQLGPEGLVLPRAEPLLQRQGNDRRRPHVAVSLVFAGGQGLKD